MIHQKHNGITVDEDTINNIFQDLVAQFHDAQTAPITAGKVQPEKARYEGMAYMYARFTGQDVADVLKAVQVILL